ncbi:MAG: hypothetical protein ACETV0_06650 [Nitrososphaeria archaeon]
MSRSAAERSMGNALQVVMHNSYDFHRSKWRNSALDEYVERGNRGGRSARLSPVTSGAVHGESRPGASHRKREPIFGSLSAKRSRYLVHS